MVGEASGGMGNGEATSGGVKLRNLASFLVHLFGRDGDAPRGDPPHRGP